MPDSPDVSTASLFAQNLHPRLFFGPEDIPALREKAKTGIPGRALAEMLRRCAKFTGPSSPDFINPDSDAAQLLKQRDGDGEHVLLQALHCLSFAYVLTGDDKWGERGSVLLRALLRDDNSWREVGQAAHDATFALACDLLWNAMTAEDHDRTERFLRQCVLEPYRKQVLNIMNHHIWGLGTNMFLHGFLPYVETLAVVYRPKKDEAALRQCDSLARRALHLGVDDGGAIFEGPSYGWTDSVTLSFVAEILRRAGVSDLWTEEPRMAKLSEHWAYLILPGGRGQNTMCDAWRYAGDRPFIQLLLHAHRFSDPARQWTWEHMGGRGSVETLGTAPERFAYNLGHIVLWEEDSRKAQTPGEARWPSARCSGKAGVITMRSGWGDEDVYFTLLAAGRTPGCCIHQHVDAGHFTLFALNEAFSVDTGYGDIMGRYHSVMMPGAVEPRETTFKFDQVWFGGTVAAFSAGRQADYAQVDVSRQWDCRCALRSALLVRGPGAYPYIVMLDDFNYRSDLLNFLWLMNSEPGNTITVDEENVRATVTGRRHRLEVAWSYPRPDDYFPRHRMELETDSVNSFPLAHRDSDVDYFHGVAAQHRPEGYARWGAGIRPRLKATLWGLNGHLLTMLVPRRHGESPIETARIGAMGHFGMTVKLGEVTDTIVASPTDRFIDLGGMRGEAALAVARRDAAGKLLWWAAADAMTLDVDGKTVLPRRGEAAVLVEKT